MAKLSPAHFLVSLSEMEAEAEGSTAWIPGNISLVTNIYLLKKILLLNYS